MSDIGVVVLSGGLDSGTALGMAVEQHGAEYTYAISFDYGQRHKVELEQAKALCDWYGIAMHCIASLPNELFVGGVLTDASKDVEDMRYDDLASGTMSPTYVPFRNGNLLAQATAWADSLLRPMLEAGYDVSAQVWAGQHAEDAAGFAYADCTPEFLGAMAAAIYIGTYHKVRLWTPFAHLGKADVIRIGKKLGVPYELTHSCYRGDRPACGACSTCHARLEAFEAAGFKDPLDYARR
jgi:7-cyano-7-deazaguanine synthase